jgi:hypothetical protein
MGSAGCKMNLGCPHEKIKITVLLDGLHRFLSVF